MVRTGGFSKQQTHGISLISERRLNSDENISKLLSVNNKVLSVRVQVSWSRSPVLLEVLSIRSQIVILFSAHAVCNIELGRGNLCLGIVQNGLHDSLLLQGCISDIISLGLHLLQDCLDGVKHIKVSSSSYITLIRGEGEDGDGNLLVLSRLGSKSSPLQCTVGQQVHTVSKGNTASGGTLTSSKDNRLNGSINLRKGNLQCYLNRMESQFR
mmetsp:Transcript_23287/g.34499  ORF Transcript_23287/g.34499 Transcript_23287/m.34499 type:complete len:212 (+) Transcript_23287:2371-3006(+)